MARPVALVLCGGMGERMRPWSERRPKTLLGLADGTETLFSRHVRELASRGFAVCANPQPMWARAHRDEARSAGARLRLLPQTTPPKDSGTVIAELARTLRPETPIVVVYGDVWFPTGWYERARDVAHLVAQGEHAVAVAAGLLPSGEPRRGMLRLDSDPGRNHCARMLAVSEDGGDAKARHHSTGMVIVRAGAVPSIRGDLARDFLPRLVHHGMLAFGVADDVGSQVDCGDLARYAGLCVREYLDNFGIERYRGEDGAAESLILRANKIRICGNGGSLAIAMHAAQDWAKLGRVNARALTDLSLLTAYANDVDYARAFSCQFLTDPLASGACLVLFSGSGTSPNIAEAARAGKVSGASVVLVTSSDGGKGTVADIVVRAPWPTRRMQECEDFFGAWSHAVARVMTGLSPWDRVDA